MKNSDLPHFNISSYPGGGKTTLIERLLEENPNWFLLPKVSTRPPRPIERIPEYIFTSPEEFEEKKMNGEFANISEVESHGSVHYHAILKPEYWPPIPHETTLLLSAYGSKAPFVKRTMPNMRLVFIDFVDKTILSQRLKERTERDGSDYEAKSRKIGAYIQQQIEKNYEDIIYNDSCIEETVAQFYQLVEG